MGGRQEGTQGFGTWGRGDAATSSPGHLSLALEVRREKALASASHKTNKHTEFVGVFN